jgi:hypothetical protein
MYNNESWQMDIYVLKHFEDDNMATVASVYDGFTSIKKDSYSKKPSKEKWGYILACVDVFTLQQCMKRQPKLHQWP